MTLKPHSLLAAGLAVLAAPAAHADLVITPAAGFDVTWDGNEGVHFDAAAPPVGSVVPDNLALAANGAAPIGSSELEGSAIHFITRINDGVYGNTNSWIGATGDPEPFIGVDLGGAFALTSVAWGRDNGSAADCCGGQLRDRSNGLYVLQVTTDQTVGAGSNWTDVAFFDYASSDDDAIGGGFTSYFRHEYTVRTSAGDAVFATGVRLLVPGTGINFGTAVDELEVYGESAIIAATDFTGRTVSGPTASNITWTTRGVADPGDLTVIDHPSGPVATLFDSGAAQGHFAVDKNTQNEGPWSVDIPLVPAVGTRVTLHSVVLDWQHFNNAGNLQAVNRTVTWTATVSGSTIGPLAGGTATGSATGMSGLETLTFDPPLVLTGDDAYVANIFVSGSGPGNNTGFDGLTFLGTTRELPDQNLSLRQFISADSVVAGSPRQNLFLMVMVTNRGSTVATGVEIGIAQTLPAGVQVAYTIPDLAAPTLWPAGDLQPGQTKILNVQLRVGPEAEAGSDVIVSTARVELLSGPISTQVTASIEAAPVNDNPDDAASALGLALQAAFPDDFGDPESRSTVWGPNADPDGDGHKNFIEFAFGSDPDDIASVPQVTLEVVEVEGEDFAQLTFDRRVSINGLVYIVELSPDMQNWAGGFDFVRQFSVTPGAGGLETVVYRAASPLQPGATQTLRVFVKLLRNRG